MIGQSEVIGRHPLFQLVEITADDGILTWVSTSLHDIILTRAILIRETVRGGRLFLLLFIVGCGGRPVVFPDTGIEWLDVDIIHQDSSPCATPELREETPFSAWEPWDDWGSVPADNTEYQYTGGGLVIADLNGDKSLDLYLPTAGTGQLILSNGAGGWFDSSEASLPDESGLGVGACAADPDGDGDTDIYLLNLHQANQLLINDGTGVFTDQTLEANLGTEALDSTSCTWADIEGDDDLDLLVANHYEGTHLATAIVDNDFIAAHDNKFYRNEGELYFEDQSSTLPTSFRDGYGFLIAVEDLDDDGQPELYSVNDFGPLWRPNQVVRANGEDWSTDQELIGLDVSVYGMGTAISDINGDEIPDFALTSWGEIALLESSGDRTWIRSATARGVTLNAEQQTSWGAEFVDLDNDKDMDLITAFGPLVMPDEIADEIATTVGLITIADQPDALYVQDEHGAFTDQAEAWGIDDRGIGRGFVVADLNGDGWLDIIKRDLAGSSIAWQANCGDAQSVSITLEQEGMNIQAIGAQIRATVGDQVMTGKIRAGGTGHASSAPPLVHFGIGNADQIDQLRIVWPDGEYSRLFDIAPGQLHVTRSRAP